MKFKKAYLEYLEIAKLKMKPTSLNTFKRKIEKHVLNEIENKKIEEITSKDIRNIERLMVEKNLSASMINNTIYCINSIYKYLESEYKVNNVCKNIEKVKEYKPKTNNIWNKKEIKRFLKVIDEPYIKLYFELLIYTGARKNEILALQFKDITKKELKISKSITREYYNGKKLILSPKSRTSNRIIQINKKIYKKVYKFYNNNPEEMIFKFSNTTIERKMKEYCLKANIKKIRIHDIRHTIASQLFQNGIDIKCISERLGHSSTSITLDTYIHKNSDFKDRTNKVLSKYI